MNVPLNFIYDKLYLLANSGKTLYLISLSIFIAEFTFGALYLLWLSTMEKLKTRGTRFIYYIYQFCFLIDFGVCTIESVFVGRYFQNVAVAYFTCLVKFVLLLLLYGLVCAHKAILNLREKEQLIVKNKKALNDVKEFTFSAENSVKKAELTASENELDADKMFDKTVDVYQKSGREVDVNVAYVKEIIKVLKQKQLTDEDLERLSALDFELNSLCEKEENAVRRLNCEFQFLVQKMTEYNVNV